MNRPDEARKRLPSRPTVRTRRPHGTRATARTAALLACLALAACGGSGSDDDPDDVPNAAGRPDGGPVGAGDTGGGGGGGTTDPGTGGGGIGAGSADTLGADLSHAGVRVPSLDVDPSTAPLFSRAGAERAADLPDDLGVIIEVVENHGNDLPFSCKELGAEYASCSVVNLHVKGAGDTLAGDDWRLYFHSIRRVLRADSDAFDVTLVNGDLNYLSPRPGTAGIVDGVATIRLVTEFNWLIESDFMPRAWLVRGDGEPVLAANTDEDTDERAYAMPISGENRRAFNSESIALATPATRFAENAGPAAIAAGLSAAEIQRRIVPQPRSLAAGTGSLDVSGGFSFAGAPLSPATLQALEARQATFMGTAAAAPLSASIDPALGAEAYTLEVTTAGIEIVGGDEAGLFYGAQSLLGLVRPGAGTIPAVRIEDSPRFGFRGMHVDVARNFHGPETLKRVIDQLGAYKLNVLHLHLTDDEGWRLEIPGLPELTGVGARRAFATDENGDVFEGESLMPQLGSGPGDDTAGTGFLSRDEFVDLLEYAAARHVRVVPEIDMPGHARAAVIAMRARAARLGTPESVEVRIDDPDDASRYLTIQHYDDGILNPCVPGTYAFVETVVTELAAMYADAGLALETFHMGGDEARSVYTEGGGFEQTGGSTAFLGDADLEDWDQPWERSPACEAYIEATPEVSSREDLQPHFVRRVSEIVAAAGVPALYAWQDIYDERPASELATDRVGVNFWKVVHTGGYREINDYPERGYETVVSVPDFLYFDFPEEVDPEERGYYWATRSTGTRKVFGFAPENLPQNAETSVTGQGRPWSASGEGPGGAFAGMQGHLWGETVRTGEQIDYMAFPRLLALAERAWHRADWERDYDPDTVYSGGTPEVPATGLVDTAAREADWASFAAALGTKELAKLDAAGVGYRIPVPGARVGANGLEMNASLPGIPLEYDAGGGFEPYAPGTAATATAVRARSADGERAGRADALE